MIVDIEIINQPISGQYEEVVYEIKSVWNSPNWTYVKFTNDDYKEWCGHFRGAPIKLARSLEFNRILVLTTDFVYLLDESGVLIEYEKQAEYRDITVSPNGFFVMAAYYCLKYFSTSLSGSYLVKSDLDIDFIELKNWEDNKLVFECTEIGYYENEYEMTLDCETWEINRYGT